MAPYQYKALGQTEIRLLQIDPGKPGDPIRCVLQHHKLKQAPAYTALSYCWGAPIFDHVLYLASSSRFGTASRSLFGRSKDKIKSSEIWITRSLHYALSRIRTEENAMLIWADAVCINQENVREKNVQVRMMGQIYRSASQTLIDVGEEADGSQLVPSLVEQILTLGIRQSSFAAAFISENLPPEGDRMWEAWEAFFQRPWFHRVWVIQEAALAAQAIVLCGSWRLAFDDIVTAAESPVQQTSKKYNKFATGRRMAINMKETGRTAMATEAVDYLYGVLGLSIEGQRAELQPDYGEAPSKTIRRYLSYFVAVGHGLDLLSFVNCETWKPGHPTWFSQWTSQEDPSTKIWSPLTGPSPTYSFQVAGSTKQQMTHVDVEKEDKNWLVVKGVAIDVVSQLGKDRRNDPHPEPLGDEIYHHPLCSWLLEPDELRRRLRNADSAWHSWFTTEDDWQEAKWQTMVAGTIEPAIDSEPSTPYTYAYCYEVLTQTRTIPRDAPDFDDYENLLFDYFNNVNRTKNYLLLCMTKTLGLLGAVPHGTQEGDIVVLFLGAEIPYVLRPRPVGQEGFMVVGGCYMHGIMRGELEASLGLDNPTLREWVLS